jgi:hypothetical protein
MSDTLARLKMLLGRSWVSDHGAIADLIRILIDHFEAEAKHDNSTPDAPDGVTVEAKIERCRRLADEGWTVDIQMTGHCNFVTISCFDDRELEVKHEGQGKTLSEALDAALAKVSA